MSATHGTVADMTTETAQFRPSQSTPAAGGIALLVVLFASFMDLLDATIVVVAAPAIAADLHATDSQIQWTIAAYTLALGSGLITGGRIGDDYGRRRVFLTALAAFALTSALCALAPNAGLLILARALQGLAAGLMVPQVFGIIRASLSPEQMGKALGAYGSISPSRRWPSSLGLAPCQSRRRITGPASTWSARP